MQKEIDRLLEAVVIRESTSDFCSPMVPVKQRGTSDIRITVNFSRLNAQMKDVRFPMTNPEAMLNKVRGKRYVSTVDLRQSFFQLEITEKKQKVYSILGRERSLRI